MPLFPSNPAAPAGWWAECLRRHRTLWPAKAAGIAVGMTLFFWAYFWLLRHPLSPPTCLPLTALDRWLPFWPPAVLPYVSLWVYVGLPISLQPDWRRLRSSGLAWIALAGIGLAIFLLWPTRVPPHTDEWDRFTAFSSLGQIDAAGNACPSLHVAFALLSAIWLHAQCREIGAPLLVRAGNWLWCAAIVYSTLATHQHVALDVVAGAALGSLVASVHLYLTHRSRSLVPLHEPLSAPLPGAFAPILPQTSNEHRLH